MKPIPLNIQKRLMWIPAANVLIMPIWFWNSFYWDKKVKTLPKTLWILFTTGFPVMVLNVLIMVYAPHLETVMNVVCGYLVPLVLSHRLIRYQEELNETINRKEKQK